MSGHESGWHRCFRWMEQGLPCPFSGVMDPADSSEDQTPPEGLRFGIPARVPAPPPRRPLNDLARSQIETILAGSGVESRLNVPAQPTGAPASAVRGQLGKLAQAAAIALATAAGAGIAGGAGAAVGKALGGFVGPRIEARVAGQTAQRLRGGGRGGFQFNSTAYIQALLGQGNILRKQTGGFSAMFPNAPVTSG